MTKFQLGNCIFTQKMYINNIYLAPTMKSKSIYHIPTSQNCEMSFISFSEFYS